MKTRRMALVCSAFCAFSALLFASSSVAQAPTPPENVLQRAREFGAACGVPTQGTPWKMLPDLDDSGTVVSWSFGWRWTSPEDDPQARACTIDVAVPSNQVMSLSQRRGPLDRPLNISASDAEQIMLLAAQRAGMSVAQMEINVCELVEQEEGIPARWSVGVMRNVAGMLCQHDSARANVHANTGLIRSFISTLPPVYLPPSGAILPEEQAKALARQAYVAAGGPAVGPVYLPMAGPSWEVMEAGSNSVRPAYWIEFQRDETPSKVDSLRVMLDAVTGEVWWTGPIYAGPSHLREAPASAARRRFELAARLERSAEGRKWARELMAGSTAGSAPKPGDRRWWVGSGADRIELAGGQKGTLWARREGSEWLGSRITATQAKKLAAIEAGKTSHELHVRELWKAPRQKKGSGGAKPGAKAPAAPPQ